MAIPTVRIVALVPGNGSIDASTVAAPVMQPVPVMRSRKRYTREPTWTA